jgi:diguanylate cyclase (GGDEF)-like protein
MRLTSGNCFGEFSAILASLRRRARDGRLWQNRGQTNAKGSTEHASIDRFGSERRINPAPCLVSIVARAVLGAALSFATYSAVAVREDNAVKQDFMFRASNAASALQSGMDAYFDKISALRALFESSDGPVSRQTFEIFADRLLRGQSAILSVSWIPRVGHDQLAAYERAAALDGIAGYHIKSFAPDNAVKISPEEDEYYPIYYTTEKRQAASIYGLNLGDKGTREQALVRSRDSNGFAASESLMLQFGSGDRRGFFVVLPVYRQGVPQDTVESRRRNLVGFVQGVFQTSTMVETILGGLRMPVDLYVFEAGAGDNAFLIRASKPKTQPIEPSSVQNVGSGMHWSGELSVADQRWKLVGLPPPGWKTPRHLTAWTLLIAGLLLTTAGVAFMWWSRRYARRLIRANRKVSELARTDPLTSLANRRAFLDLLAGSFAASKRGGSPFAVLYIDLDHFKDVNDTLGHTVGDILLRQVAERLKTRVRKSDIVARIGGDEFAVLLTQVGNDTATGTLATGIIETLAAPYVIGDDELHVTASIGASRFSAEFSQPEAIMIQADLALYRAKEDGRNCFRFHDKHLDQQVLERVVLSDELRAAIEHRELELHYQPQVEIVSGRIVGLEALVRWNHPKRGFVPPSTFIPIAEKSGAIVPLGKWVFDEACRQASIWQSEGIAPEAIGVNISTIQCNRSDIARDFAESLARWGVNVGTMEVELTESVLMEVTEHHCGIIERLRELGLRIAIDDFGTGYSSLSYLTNYPVDRLKIAQELVLSVDTNHRHASVVRTAIRLAHELEIQVIAEGVETEAQACFLASADCAYAQGYHYSRPINAALATELLRQGKVSTSEREQCNTPPQALSKHVVSPALQPGPVDTDAPCSTGLTNTRDTHQTRASLRSKRECLADVPHLSH